MSDDDDCRDIQSLLRRAHDAPPPEPGFVRRLGERLARELSATPSKSEHLPAHTLRLRRRLWLRIPAAAAAIALVAVAVHLWPRSEDGSPPANNMQIALGNLKAEHAKVVAEPRQPGVAGSRVSGTPKPTGKQASMERATERLGQGSSLPARLSLRERSLEQNVANAQVIVVATALDPAPAPVTRPGDLPENLIRFQVARVLKGKLADKFITTRTPTAAGEFIGKQWVLLLSPEFMAGKHQYADCNWIKAEAEVKAILSKLSDVGSREPAWGEPVNGLRLGLYPTDRKGDGKVRLMAVLENVSTDDLTVNLGLMLGNGKKQLPTAVRLIFTSADGKKRILERKVGAIAGRVDAFGVPLAAGCRYTIACNLAEYYDDALLSGLALAPGRYRVTAEFVGKVPANTTALALMYYWSGTIESDRLQVTLPAKTAKQEVRP
jgi:hypothetical protein